MQIVTMIKNIALFLVMIIAQEITRYAVVARYKKNWRNGLGLSAGRVATEYYLIRIPDQTFVKDQQTK